MVNERMIGRKRHSTFYKVECPKCKEICIVYSHVATKINCRKCNTLLAEPTGGRSAIYGKVVENLEH